MGRGQGGNNHQIGPRRDSTGSGDHTFHEAIQAVMEQASRITYSQAEALVLADEALSSSDEFEPTETDRENPSLLNALSGAAGVEMDLMDSVIWDMVGYLEEKGLQDECAQAEKAAVEAVERTSGEQIARMVERPLKRMISGIYAAEGLTDQEREWMSRSWVTVLGETAPAN